MKILKESKRANRKARLFCVLNSFISFYPRTTNGLSYRETPAFRRCRNDSGDIERNPHRAFH